MKIIKVVLIFLTMIVDFILTVFVSAVLAMSLMILPTYYCFGYMSYMKVPIPMFWAIFIILTITISLVTKKLDKTSWGDWFQWYRSYLILTYNHTEPMGKEK